MIPGLERVLARRVWFVPDFVVWGLPAMGDLDYLAATEINSTGIVQYGTKEIGESEQEVLYSQLTDHRGNQLPDSISSPRVLVRHKGVPRAFVSGRESTDRFRIARDPEADSPITADLLVVELGD